jgi:hypothetical protein
MTRKREMLIQNSEKLEISIISVRKRRIISLRVGTKKKPILRFIIKIIQQMRPLVKTITVEVTKAGWRIGFLKTT